MDYSLSLNLSVNIFEVRKTVYSSHAAVGLREERGVLGAREHGPCSRLEWQSNLNQGIQVLFVGGHSKHCGAVLLW